MGSLQELDDLLSEDLAHVREREASSLGRILAESGGRCVLFGAGSLGRTVLRNLLRDGVRPLAFADNNSKIWNTSVEGVPVLSPAEAVAEYPDAAFFVTIWTTGHRYAETYAQLTAAGAHRVYPAASLRWKYAADLLPFYCQDFAHKVYQEAEGVRAAFALWSDQLSRDEYLRQIRFRALGDYQNLAAPDAEPSYFLDSLYSLLPGELFVDCGAYDGDTVREVLQRAGSARIVALEPDAKSLASFESYLASLPPETAARIQVHPYAASDRARELRFNAIGELGSAISDGDGVPVEAIALDELLGDRTPTFIKMDIEGAEVDALEGSRNLIARNRPLLSICVYHRQNDLWRIPLLIDSICPGYRYFLRSHDVDGWQTVAYAIPPERLR